MILGVDRIQQTEGRKFMGRLGFILGIILMIISMVLLFEVIEENSPLTLQLVAIFNCGQGEKATQELGSYIAGRGGRPVSFACVNAQGEERDVSIPGFFSMMSAFLVPFLAGMALTASGVRSAARSGVSKLAGTVLNTSAGSGQAFTFTTSNPGSVVINDAQNLTPEQQAKMQQAMNMLDKMMPGVSIGMANQGAVNQGTAGSTNLTARLQELENARQQGLITPEEYTRLRQQILDGIA
jgi:hypothetical protein